MNLFRATASAGLFDSTSGKAFVSPFTTLLASRTRSIINSDSSKNKSDALTQARAELAQELGFSEDDVFNFLSDYVALQNAKSVSDEVKEQALFMHGTAQVLTGLLTDVQAAVVNADSNADAQQQVEDVAMDNVLSQVDEVVATVEKALDEATTEADKAASTEAETNSGTETSTTEVTTATVTSVHNHYKSRLSGLRSYHKNRGGHRYGGNHAYNSTALSAIASVISGKTSVAATAMLGSVSGVQATFPQYVYNSTDATGELLLKSKNIEYDGTTFSYTSSKKNLGTGVVTDTSNQTTDMVALTTTGWQKLAASNYGVVQTDGTVDFYHNSTQTTPFATAAASVSKLGDLTASGVTIANTMGYLHGGAKKLANLLNDTATFPADSNAYLVPITYTAQAWLDDTAAIESYTGATADTTSVLSLTGLLNTNGTSVFTDSNLTTTLKSVRLRTTTDTTVDSATIGDSYEVFVAFVQGTAANAGNAYYYSLYTDVSANTKAYTLLRTTTYTIAKDTTSGVVDMLTASSMSRKHRSHGSNGRGQLAFSVYNNKIYRAYQHNSRTVERLFLNKTAYNAVVAAIDSAMVTTVLVDIATRLDATEAYHDTHSLFHYLARESRHYLRDTISLFFKF